MPSVLLSEWQLPSGGFLIIGEDVIRTVCKYRQLTLESTEAGGILLGYRRGPHLEAVAITEPGAKDIRKRRYFERRDKGHQKYASNAWRLDPFIHYLGEWHTHPETYPAPSMLDQREWIKLGNSSPNDELVMLIIGQHGCWVGIQHQQQCYELQAVPYSS